MRDLGIMCLNEFPVHRYMMHQTRLRSHVAEVRNQRAYQGQDQKKARHGGVDINLCRRVPSVGKSNLKNSQSTPGIRAEKRLKCIMHGSYQHIETGYPSQLTGMTLFSVVFSLLLRLRFQTTCRGPTSKRQTVVYTFNGHTHLLKRT